MDRSSPEGVNFYVGVHCLAGYSAKSGNNEQIKLLQLKNKTSIHDTKIFLKDSNWFSKATSIFPIAKSSHKYINFYSGCTVWQAT